MRKIFLYRRTDKHVVEQQRSPRVDQLATHLSYLHVRGGEILEKSLSPTFPPGKLHVQTFGGADPVTPSTRGGRKREHVPAHGFQVMTLAGLCQAPFGRSFLKIRVGMILFSLRYTRSSPLIKRQFKALPSVPYLRLTHSTLSFQIWHF